MTRITAIALTALTLAVSGTAFAQDNCTTFDGVQTTCQNAFNQALRDTTSNNGQDNRSIRERVNAVNEAVTTCTNCATDYVFNSTSNSNDQ